MYNYIITRNILGGLVTPVLKILTTHLPIYPLIFIRQVIYSIIAFCRVNPKSLISEFISVGWALNVRIAISSSLYAISVMLIFISMRYIPISIFSLLEQSLVLLVGLLFGRVLLKERIAKQTYIWVVLSVIGLILVMSKGNLGGFSFAGLTGVTILLIYSVILNIGGVISVKAIKETTTEYYVLAGTVVRVMFYLPFVLMNLDDLQLFFEKITLNLWILLILLAINVYVVECLLAKSISKIGYTKTQLFTPIITVTSTIVSMIVFQQWFNVWQYIGVFIIIFAMYRITKQKHLA